jgi:Protein of unknown function (DUF2846)
MNRKSAFFLPLALAAGLALAPATALAKDKKEAAAEADEPGAMLAADMVLPKAPAGKGQIVFYRKGGFVGSAVACSAWENNQKVSSLGGGRFFVMVADPGKHTFSVKTEAKDTITLEVEPDETQFVECKIKMGIMVGRPDIRPVTEADFRAAKKLKLTDEDDMGPGPGALRHAEFKAAQEAAKAPVPAAVPEAAPAPAPAAEPAPAPAS